MRESEIERSLSTIYLRQERWILKQVEGLVFTRNIELPSEQEKRQRRWVNYKCTGSFRGKMLSLVL